MKKNFTYSIAIVTTLLLAISTLMTGCSCSGDDAFDQVSERYRNWVNAEFMQKAQRYDADTRYLIIVDYSILSNQSRMFLWDTEADGIVDTFWCAHGKGRESTAERPVFSNEPGSLCSSLGWFLVDRNTGVSPSWGYDYHAVDGLDATNSNARVRQLLIHPWQSVDNDEANHISRPMQLDGRCEGCFTTTHRAFDVLHNVILSRPKRILLCAIDGLE